MRYKKMMRKELSTLTISIVAIKCKLNTRKTKNLRMRISKQLSNSNSINSSSWWCSNNKCFKNRRRLARGKRRLLPQKVDLKVQENQIKRVWYLSSTWLPTLLVNRFSIKLFRRRKTIIMSSNNSRTRLQKINFSRLFSFFKNSKLILKMLIQTLFPSFSMLSSNRCKWRLLKC